MKTITLEEPGRLHLGETPSPGPLGKDEALVHVRRIGVCGTDLHAFRGRQPFFSYPRVLGHELGVEVAAVGEGVTEVAVGDRCAVEPYLNCGRCSACRRGKTNCCENLEVLGVHIDGGMREQIVVPANKLHPSKTLPLEALALVEMLTIGAHAVRRADVQEGETALVIGAGPIGLSVAAFAQAAGAQVAVIEMRPDRLAFCRDQLGTAWEIEAEGTTPDVLRERLGGDLPTLVFDATGNARSMHSAFDFVDSGGKLVFVGLFQGDVTFHDPDFHRRELTVMSSRNATGEDFAHVIRTLEDGTLDLTPWITHRATLGETPATFPEWLEPERGIVKAMVMLEGGEKMQIEK